MVWPKNNIKLEIIFNRNVLVLTVSKRGYIPILNYKKISWENMWLFHMKNYVNDIHNSTLTHIFPVIAEAFLLLWLPLALDPLRACMLSLALGSRTAQAWCKMCSCYFRHTLALLCTDATQYLTFWASD